MKKNFFEWIAECCRLMGKNTKYGALLCSDKNWVAAWDDDMTEEAAIAEFKESYPNGYPKDVEDKYLDHQRVA